MRMENAYPKMPKVEFIKGREEYAPLRNHPKERQLIISITGGQTGTTHNHHIKKESFMKFVTKHYFKELCEHWNVNQTELEKFILTSRI